MCALEDVTAFLEGALEPDGAARLEAHLAGCVVCRGQASAERSLRARLLDHPTPWPSAGLEGKVARSVRALSHPLDEPAPFGPWLIALAAAAGLVGALAQAAPDRRVH